MKHSAFTLIEMLISISIFMIFIAILGGSYTSLVRANRTANEAQKTYREVRFVFDTLASEIRGGRLDYSCIDMSGLDVLCLDNQTAGEKKVLGILRNGGLSRTLFKFMDKKILVLSQTRAALLAPWATTRDWQPLTTEELNIDTAYFTVFPLRDPYASSNALDNEVQWQPTVSIFISTGGHHFRTTYALRAYGNNAIFNFQ